MLISRICLLSFVFVLITLNSCHKKVDWLPPAFQQKPVVSGVIKSGELIDVKVSLAVAFNAQSPAEVDNAEVQLYVDNQYEETLEYAGNGHYQSVYVAEEERDYRCEVSIPNFQTAVCSTFIPKQKNIIQFEHINKAGVDEEGLTYPAVKVTFENIPNQINYYELVINLFSSEEIFRPSLLSIIDPVLLNEGLPIAVFSNEMIDGDSYTMLINYTTGSAYNQNNSGWVTELFPVQVELRSVCFNYYTFIKQQYLYEMATDEPFLSVGSVGVFNLHSNVENGYGILAGYSSVKSEIINP
jgi:hypothetical protein